MFQKIENWFQNNRPHVKKAKGTSRHVDHRISHAWTVRKVVQQTMKDRIAAHVLAEDPSAVPGSQTYLTQYQKACSHITSHLTEDEKRECEELVNQWNAQGPDPETKAL